MLSTVIEFVSSGGGHNPVNPGAQTSDMMFVLCAVLFVLIAVGALFVGFKKSVTVGSPWTHVVKMPQKSKKIFAVAISILALCMAVFSITGARYAFAANQDATQASTKVQAIVDELTGTVTIENATVTNDTTEAIVMKSIAFNLKDGIDDGKCNWDVAFDGVNVYSGLAGKTVELGNKIGVEPGQSLLVGFKTDVTPKVAKSLIGKEVAVISYGTAPAPTQSVTGKVVDKNGNPVPNVKVAIYNADTGERIDNGTLQSDTNGNYTYNGKLPKNIIITYEGDNNVAPTQIIENVGYDPVVVDPVIAKDKSTLSGHIEDAPSTPPTSYTWAIFTTEDGDLFYDLVEPNGNYDLPVSADTPGTLTFITSDDNLTPPSFDTTSPHSGETKDMPNTKMLEKDSTSTVSYDVVPPQAGVEVTVVVTDPDTGETYTYPGITDDKGHVDVNIPSDMPSQIIIEYKDPVTGTDVTYTEDIEPLSPGQTHEDSTPDLRISRSVNVDLAGGHIESTNVPAGWVKTKSNPETYAKDFVVGSDVVSVEQLWNTDLIYRESYQFKTWEPNGGKITQGAPGEAFAITAIWLNLTIQGKVYNDDGTPADDVIVEVYDKNTGKPLATGDTDENGNYEFNEEEIPTGSDVIITYKTKKKPGNVGPSQNITAGEQQPQDTKLDENKSSDLNGEVKGLPEQDPSGEPSVWAGFKDDNNNIYYAPVNPDPHNPGSGTFDIPVPSGTKGDIFFYVFPDTENNYVPSMIDNVDTPDPGTHLDEQNGIILKKDDSSEVKYNVIPIPNPPIDVTYTTQDDEGNIYTFKGETDPNTGEVDLIVPPDTDGDINFKDNEGNDFSGHIDGSDLKPGKPYVGGDVHTDALRNVVINLNGGSISDTYVPEGWEKIASPVSGYAKNYIVHSSVVSIITLWDTSKITRSGYRFTSWDQTTGKIEEGTSPFVITAGWEPYYPPVGPSIEGYVYNDDGSPVQDVEVTVYDKNTGDPIGKAKTNKDGKYEFNDIPDGTEVILTYEGDDPSKVAPSQEFTVGEEGKPEKSYLDENDKSILSGEVEGLPPRDPQTEQPNVWAKFTDPEGNEYIIPVTPDPQKPGSGTYKLPVPSDTIGDLEFFIYPEDENFIPSKIKDTETPHPGREKKNQDGIVIDKNDKVNTVVVEYELVPCPEDTTNIEVVYKAIDETGKEFEFEGTIENCKATFYVPENMDGEIFIKINKGEEGSEEYSDKIPKEDLDPSKPYKKQVDINTTRKVEIDLNGGTIDDMYVPEGWVKGESNKYTKDFVLKSSVVSIIDSWDVSKIINPDYSLDKWIYSGDVIEEGVDPFTIKAEWKLGVKRDVHIDLNGGDIAEADVPEGWTLIEDAETVVYSKVYVVDTPVLVEDVIYEWDTSKFTYRAHNFDKWQPNTGTIGAGKDPYSIQAQWLKDDHFLAEPSPFYGAGIFQAAFELVGFDATFATSVEFKKVDNIEVEIAANARPNPLLTKDPENPVPLAVNVSASHEGPVFAYIANDVPHESYKMVVVTDNSEHSIYASEHSFKRMFANFSSLYSVDFGAEGVLDKFFATDYTYMYESTGKKNSGVMPTIKFDSGREDTFKVAAGSNLENMFHYCNASVDLSSLDVSEAGSIDRMFSEYCHDIPAPEVLKRITLKLSDTAHGFKMPKTGSMYGMFNSCNYQISKLSTDMNNDVVSIIDQMDLSESVNLSGLFYMYKGVYRYGAAATDKPELNVSKLNYNIEKTKYMADMFAYVYDGKIEAKIIFTDPDVESDTFKLAENSSGMFKGCDFYELDLTKADFTKVKDASYMFEDYGSLALFTEVVNIKFPDLQEDGTGGLVFADGVDLGYMFCKAVTPTDIFHHISRANAKKIGSVVGMFDNFGNLTETEVMFGAESLKISFPQDASATDHYQIGGENASLEKMFRFAKCNVELANLSTSNIKNFDYMFEGFGYIYAGESKFNINTDEGKWAFQTANNASVEGMFDTVQLMEIDLAKFLVFESVSDTDKTGKIQNFSYMFRNYGLKYQIDITFQEMPFGSFKGKVIIPEAFKTATDANMSHMFDGLRDVDTTNKLDLTNLDVSKVVNFDYMFQGFNTYWDQKFSFKDREYNINLVFPEGGWVLAQGKDISMQYMFYEAQAVTSTSAPSEQSNYQACFGNLNLGLKLDTSQATSVNMSHMYDSCFGKLSNQFIEYMSVPIRVYYRCCIDVSDWNISKVNNMSYMFYQALPKEYKNNTTSDSPVGLAGDLKLFSGQTGEKCDCSYMFSYIGAKEIALGTSSDDYFSTANVENFNFMFSNYAHARYPGVISGLNTLVMTNANNVKGMFYNSYFNQQAGDETLTIDLKDMGGDEGPIASVKDLSYMFYGLKCDVLDISTWNPKECVNMEGMFAMFGYNPQETGRYSQIKFPEASGSWTTGSNCSMKLMFCMCMTDVNLSGFNVSKVNDMTGMFLAYGNSIEQLLQFLPFGSTDKKLSDKDFTNSALAGILTGNTEATDNMINELSNPLISKLHSRIQNSTGAIDSFSSEYTKMLNSSSEALTTPEIDYNYGNEGLDKFGFTKEDFADSLMEANLSELSSSYYNDQIFGVADSSFGSFTDDFKKELANIITNSDMPDLIASLLPEDVEKIRSNNSQSNLMLPFYKITFPTGDGAFAPATAEGVDGCSMLAMFCLCNAFNFPVSEKKLSNEDEPLSYVPNFKGFNTAKVTNMAFMFTGFMFGSSFFDDDIQVINEFDLSSFDTTNVKSMSLMFAFFGDVYGHYEDDPYYMTINKYTTKIKFGENFKLGSTCNVHFMFMWCRATEIDGKYLLPSNLTDISFMFTLCCAEKLDLSEWGAEETSQITNMNYLFALYGLPAILIDHNTSFTFSSFYDPNAIKIGGAEIETGFGIADNETKYKQFTIGKDTQCKGMFIFPVMYNINLENVDVSARTSLAHMFELCVPALYTLIGGIDKVKLNDSITDFTLDISTWDVSKVIDYSYMFAFAEFTNTKLPNMGTGKIATGADMNHMFFMSLILEHKKSNREFDSATSSNEEVETYGLDLSTWPMGQIANMRGMFFGYGILAAQYDLFSHDNWLTFGRQEINSCVDMSHMFELSCMSVDISKVKVSGVKKLNKMFAFYGLTGLLSFGDFRFNIFMNEIKFPIATENDTSAPFTTAEDADCDFMFMGTFAGELFAEYDVYIPAVINLNFLDTSKVTRMEGMFFLCADSVDLSTINTLNVRSTKMMFMGYGLANYALEMFLGLPVQFSAFIKLPKAPEPGNEGESKFKIGANCDNAFMFSLMTGITWDLKPEPGNIIKEVTYYPVLDLNGIDVSDCTNFHSMFALGSGFINFDNSKWDLSKAKNLNFMYAGYGLPFRLLFGSSGAMTPPSIKNYFPEFNMKNDGCSTVGMFSFALFNAFEPTDDGYIINDTLDLTNFDFSHVNWSYGMFAGYNLHATFGKNFSTIALPTAKIKFNTEPGSVKFQNGMDLTSFFAFSNAHIDISGFDVSNLSSLNSFFAFFGMGYTNKESVQHAWNVTMPTDGIVVPAGCSVRQMFAGYQADSAVESKINTTNVTDMTRMFAFCDCRKLNVSSWDTSNVEDMKEMFALSSSQELDMGNWSFNKVKDMRLMFAGYGSNSRKWGGIDYEPIIYFPGARNDNKMITAERCDATAMFLYCNLRSLNLYGFNVENITNLDYMFAFSDGLAVINVDQGTDWYQDGYSIKSGAYMFHGCESLTGQKNTKYSEMYEDIQYARLDKKEKPGYFSGSYALRESLTEEEAAAGKSARSIFYKDEDRSTGFSYEQLQSVKKVEFVTGDIESVLSSNDVINADVSYDQSGTVIASLNTENQVLSVITPGPLYASDNSLQALFSKENDNNPDEPGFDKGGLFKSLQVVDFGDNFWTNSANNASNMFSWCSNLQKVDLTQISLDNVTDMHSMFLHAGDVENPVEITLYDPDKDGKERSWVNTKEVTDFNHMFYHAFTKDLDLSRFNILPEISDDDAEGISVDFTYMFAFWNYHENYNLNYEIKFPEHPRGFAPRAINVVAHYDRMFALTKTKNNSLNLSSFALDDNDTAESMFSHYFNDTNIDYNPLEKIIVYQYEVNCTWKVKPENSTNMFLTCKNLKGHENTQIKFSHPWEPDPPSFPVDSTWAQPDIPAQGDDPAIQGLFTYEDTSRDKAYLRERLDVVKDKSSNNEGIFEQIYRDGKSGNTINDIQFTRDSKPEKYLYKEDFSRDKDGSAMLYLIDCGDNDLNTNNTYNDINEISNKRLSLVINSNLRITIDPNDCVYIDENEMVGEKGMVTGSIAYKMFYDIANKYKDKSLSMIDLRNFSFASEYEAVESNSTWTEKMFCGLENLQHVYFKYSQDYWNNAVFYQVRSPYDMFKDCKNLKTIDTTNWGWYGRTEYEQEDVEHFSVLILPVSHVSDLKDVGMFRNCEKLSTITARRKTTWGLEGFDKQVVNIFQGCSSLEAFGDYGYVSHESADNPDSIIHASTGQLGQGYFSCGNILKNAYVVNNEGILDNPLPVSEEKLELSSEKAHINTVIFSGEDRSECTAYSRYLVSESAEKQYAVYCDLYYEAETGYTLSFWTKNTYDGVYPRPIYASDSSLYAMFRGFSSLKQIIVDDLDESKKILNTSAATTTSRMFENEKEETFIQSSLNLYWLDTSNVTDFSYMFHNSKYEEISFVAPMGSPWETNASAFNFDNATNLSHMFDGAGYMGDVPEEYTSNSAWFCYSKLELPSKANPLHPDKYHVQPNCDCSYMFANSKFHMLNLSNLVLDNATNFDHMFAYSGVYDLNSLPFMSVNDLDNFSQLVNAYAESDENSIHDAFNKIIEDGQPLDLSAVISGAIAFPTDEYWGACTGVESNMNCMFTGSLYGNYIYPDDGSGLVDKQYAAIDLHKMKTVNVSDMGNMFTDTFLGESVLFSKEFNTRNSKNLFEMFSYAGSLTGTGKYKQLNDDTKPPEKDEDWKDSNICHDLIFSFSTSSICEGMFQGATIPVDLSSSEAVDETGTVITGRGTNQIQNYTRMFCDYGFNVLSWVFDGQPDLLKIKMVKDNETWTPPVGASFQEIFRGCKAHVDLSNLDVTNVANFYGAFMSYGNLDSTGILYPDLCTITWPSKWSSSQPVINMSCMFKGYKGTDNLNELFEGFSTTNVVNMSEMFRGCKVNELDLSRFDTSKVVNASYMFSSELLRPSYVHKIILGNDTTGYKFFENMLNQNRIIDISYLFGSALVQNDCLTTIVSNENLEDLVAKRQGDKTQQMTYYEGMFQGCIELVGNADTDKVMYSPDRTDIRYAHPCYVDTDEAKTKQLGYFTGTWTPPSPSAKDKTPVVPEVNGPEVETPVVDEPGLKEPSIEVPTIEVPTIEVPTVEVPTTEEVVNEISKGVTMILCGPVFNVLNIFAFLLI